MARCPSLAARRIAVVGCAGSGKSRLARRIAARVGAVHIELDAIYHGPGWTPLAPDAFRAQVAARCAEEAWVVDGNYGVVQPIVFARAQLVVWLDLPRALVMRQIVSRSIRRVLLRTTLWNGNRERLHNLLHWDPDRSVVRWAWTRHATYVTRYEAAMVDPALAHLTFRRLRSHADAARFLHELPQRAARGV